MNAPFSFLFQEQSFTYLPEKALLWAQERAILLADLHLGKTTHFRKEGLALPTKGIEPDYIQLRKLLDRYKPEKIIVLGDLFHSKHNSEWDLLGALIADYPLVTFYLVPGNHDILLPTQYTSLGITIAPEVWTLHKVILSHHPLEVFPEGFLNICGHVHPGIRLEGKARQSASLPVFYRTAKQLILPAFGHLTGLYLLEPKQAMELVGIFAGDLLAIKR
jgi:uncharacterized protein